MIDGDGQSVTWYTLSNEKIHTSVPQNSDIPSYFGNHGLQQLQSRPTQRGQSVVEHHPS